MAGLATISPGMTVAEPYAERFKGLLGDLSAAGYAVDPKQSGGYNYRNIAGSNKLSQHAFGRAIDVNWDANARGTQGNIPPELARSLAAKHGMTWGGAWKNPDPMHFEVADAGAPVPVNQRSFMNYAGMQKSAPDVPENQQQRMSLGGPMPPPMTREPPQQGLLGNLSTSLQQPLTQQGIGLLLAGMQGSDLNAGMSAGAQRANMGTQNLIQQLEADRVRQQQQLMQGAENNPGLSSLPPEVRSAMSMMDPQSKQAFMADYMTRRSDVGMKGDLERQKAEIEMRSKLALMKGQRDYDMQSLDDIEKRFGGSQEPRPQGMPGNARKAQDGNFYVPDPNRPGKYMMWKD